MASEEIRQAVSEKNGRFSKGFMMGDASVTASVYSEDAVVACARSNPERKQSP
ncbi:hypothetical protein MUP00_08195 [Candidatus Bathyarchaeota archaeon]|nr:hypothetical protein [Candidatus Bathyarchaeota archaeon]